jgi:hypothetical protein
MLLCQGCRPFWQQAAVQHVADIQRPRLMEVMKQAGVNLGPIVNRHGAPRISHFLFNVPLAAAEELGPLDPVEAVQ